MVVGGFDFCKDVLQEINLKYPAGDLAKNYQEKKKLVFSLSSLFLKVLWVWFRAPTNDPPPPPMQGTFICLTIILGWGHLVLAVPPAAPTPATCQPNDGPVGVRALYFPTGHEDVTCNATGKYDNIYKPCERLPNIRCVGTPSQQEQGKYQWDCTTNKKISGYDMGTAVLDDYKTIYVQLRPHVDISPGCMAAGAILCMFVLCCLSGDGGTIIFCPCGDDNDGYVCTNIS